jgi:hypothetical protein
MMKNLHFLLALFILLLSACVGSAEPTLLPPGMPPQPTATPITEGQVVQPEAAFPLPAKSLAQMAVLDLADRTTVPVEKITLMSVDAMEWSDAGIGCPVEGFDYAQVITPGYEIMLQAEGTLYTYHTDQGTFIVLCLDNGPESLPVIPIQPGEKIMDGIPWMPVGPPDEGEIVDPDPIK